MQGLLKNLCSVLANSSGGAFGRRHFQTITFGGMLTAFVMYPAAESLAGLTTVELSPLVYQSTLVAPLENSREVSVLLALPSSDPTGLTAFVKHVSTPGDPLYHQYLTPQQFAERFGGNATDYTSLKNWAAANGLAVSQESVGRINLTLRGSAAQIQTLFKTQLNTYRTPSGETFYSASVKPTVPAEISAKISGLIGLTESRQLTPLVKVGKALGEDPQVGSDEARPDSGGTGPGGTFNAKDLRTIYSIPDYGKYDQNTVMAVFEQGYYHPTDTEKYFTANNLPNVKQTPVSVNKSKVVFEEGVEAEACLDIDMIVGINPNVSEVLVYVDDYHNDSFQVAIVDAITQVASDDKAQILSISYGQDEGLQGESTLDAESAALQQCATEGITVFASSGDNGAYGNGFKYPYNVSDPSSQLLVTGVGGTTLFTGPGQLWENENAWDELANQLGATGGGVSSYWALPDWQNTTVGGTSYVTGNGGSATYRNVPDVAAVGDPLTGVAVYVKDQGGWFEIGGTSVSSPIWAGYLSTINAAFSHFNLGKIGFFNPVLYAVGTAAFGFGQPDSYCNPVIQGQNGLIGSANPGYFNNFGYCNTTGNGTIWGQGLAAQLMIGQHQPGAAPGATYDFQVKIKGKSAEFSWYPSQGASGYVVAIFHRDIFANLLPTTYLTKENKLTVTLPPVPLDPYGEHYYAFLSSFNASGQYTVNPALNFNTK